MTICQTLPEVTSLVARWRSCNDRIVMTSGVFDILHRGHLLTLAQARDYGDRLVVAINSDASVKRKKGPLRPINPLSERLLAVDSLRAVDATIGFDEPGEHPIELLTSIKPDMFVKSSSEWSDKDFFFRDIVSSYGGSAILTAAYTGYSTTSFIARIVGRYSNTPTSKAEPIEQ